MFLVVSLVLLGILNVGASSSSVIGVELYGGELDDEASAIVQISDGGYIVSGYTSSLDDYAGFSSYLFLVKVDLNGNVQWNSTTRD